MNAMQLPHRILSFYGDDFTGSTDVMEVAATAGLPTILFLTPPDETMLASFPNARIIGIAGTSRSKSPAWMQETLPDIFKCLRKTGTLFVQYKVCSTFDSAPHIGNIGKAAQIGMRIFSNRPVPLVVGAPELRRYIAFGNLFAGIEGAHYRIDRHPVMAHHPITPMQESDLRLHLARQAALSLGLIDLVRLPHLNPDQDWLTEFSQKLDLLLFDTVDKSSLQQVGALLWSMVGQEPVFAVGSSGLEYALIAAWRAAGLLPPAPVLPPPNEIDRLFVVSGSCSPITERQIIYALQNGFTGLRLDPHQLLGDTSALEKAIEQSVASLTQGQDLLVYTAAGPADISGASLSATERMMFNDQLGATLGRFLQSVLQRAPVGRAVIAGGDTSSHAMQQLGIQALSFAAPLAPGCPLCRVHSHQPDLDGFEIALKGGQMGQEDIFLRAKGVIKHQI